MVRTQLIAPLLVLLNCSGDAMHLHSQLLFNSLKKKLFHQESCAPLLHHGNKVGDGAVVASLHIVGEVACWQLSLFPMVGHTLAAVTLSGAWIWAVTAFKVLSILTLHGIEDLPFHNNIMNLCPHVSTQLFCLTFHGLLSGGGLIEVRCIGSL